MKSRRSLLVNLKLLSAYFEARAAAGELTTVQGLALKERCVKLERAFKANSYDKVEAAMDDLARDFLRFVR